ncbi:MAG: beta strand repeat-containing protein, partial [Thermoanaerobaculia bacterium]
MVSNRSGVVVRLLLALTLSFFCLEAAWGQIPGRRLPGSNGKPETMEDIMARQERSPGRRPRPDHELEYPSRVGLPQHPKALAVSRFPAVTDDKAIAPDLLKIHTTASSFDGATLTDTGAFPPDSMGTVGPTQFVTFVNGRIRTFTKAGVADGVINADPDVFFASVMTPVAGAVVLNFTSDPQVRYDRFTARWYMTIIDVPCTNATCTTTAPNRLLMAVSDAASAGTISGSTVWTFFQFQADPGTNFCDYPSLGIDVNALYIGCNMFTSAGGFVGTNGYVVRKSTTLGAGPLTVTMFANMAAGAGAGPESPRGVDNVDSTATEGYFVGPDNAAFSAITFRRVSSPGSATPTISANIIVAVPTTTLSGTQTIRLVQHAGNTGGNNGLLDTLDDRFYAAVIRNGRLWSAHNFTVGTTGVASTAAASRNAARWYEFQNLTTTPALVQSGTVFDNAATRAAARQYWIPTVTVTGQGHAVMGFTMAGTPVGATPAFAGRLAGDTLGTMVGPPTAAAGTFGTTTANYNPPADPGGTSGRRWGDYSFTAVDPLDEMTVWTIQDYNQALNSYAVRVGKLAAPPPATPTCSGSPISFAGGTGNVVITATSSGGSGFYDPGTNLPAPALPFNHIAATMTNGTVNSVTFNSATQVTLNITANTGGLQNVTITNPDGQSVTANGCISVAVADLAITKTDGVATAVPGGSVTYTITASNPSATGATGATVADTFPAILTCTWTCTGAGGGTCTAAGSGNINNSVNLPVGASVTYTATCAINASATGSLSNTATVTLTGDPNAANNSATDTDTLTPQANLGITKTDGVTTATPGGSVTYTITASNAGPSNAPGSAIADTFPASLTCTWTCSGAGGGTCTAAGSGNINDAANLPSGGSVTYTASCTISAGATGTLSNTSTVAAAGGITDPTPGNNSATDSDTLAASADLAITKTDGVTTATPGGSVTYTITASNAGPSDANGSTVADTFPASLTCTWTCSGAGGGTCTAAGSGNINDAANLPSGGSVTYTASCTVSAAATGTLRNTSTVAAAGGITDPTPGNNSATDSDTLAASADLAITKTDGVTTATPGGSVTYTITASNAGPSDANGSTVADTFPASLTCTWTCSGAGGGNCTAAGSGNINDTANLPSGGSVTYTASCNISAGATGTLSNTSTVTAAGGITDPTPGNNSATDSDTLAASADLAITKTDGVTTATPGGSVTYTITA